MIRNWLKEYAQSIEENKALLNDLDTPIGDGDHGTNMSRGMQAVLAAMDTKPELDDAGLLKLTGMTLLSKVGGASGPLYGSAFIAMSKVMSNDKLDSETIKAGFEAIGSRGKSTINEKTMLDVWGPVVTDLEAQTLKLENIEVYAKKTDDMKATKGRASFLGDRSIGHRDPGAVSSQLLFETAIKAGVL
ncbi:dihydroxyacetone kinase subunit L [Erysipelothrix inopinata]|uniref:phosphoenolpyruvate--glycerone phosphotransferase n=1 Tax=Erysipelothrix inopinata TaxID=225084 RepID=A0A7G9RY83_9FIRM|nr:dihydroxyacetone kinase subunit DhaL [Erysipelothrix inopinata]QNN60558.1 dihydroxyacetone kinase subunit L [Erysipelothrix inopinata]